MTNLYTKKDGIASFSLAVVAYLIVQLVLGGALLATPTDTFLYNLLYALVPTSIFLIAFGYAKFAKKDFVQATTANVKPHVAHVLWGCLATFGLIHLMLPINELFLDMLENMGLTRPSTEIDLHPVALIVVTVLLAPVGEEFLFRGTVGRGLANANATLGIVLSGALFALFHLNAAQTLHQFVLGCFLMMLAYRSGSVWTSVIVHAFNNLAVVFLSYVVEPTGFYQNNWVLSGVLGAVVFVGGIVGYLLTTKCHATKPDQKEGPTATTWSWFVITVAICAILWLMSLFAE